MDIVFATSAHPNLATDEVGTTITCCFMVVVSQPELPAHNGNRGTPTRGDIEEVTVITLQNMLRSKVGGNVRVSAMDLEINTI